MKYLTTHKLPIAPILEQFKEETDEHILQARAYAYASISRPLDEVHSHYLELMRPIPNVNIEVEMVGVNSEKTNYVYGVEFIFTNAFLYHPQTKEQVDNNELPIPIMTMGPAGKIHETLAMKIGAFLTQNKIQYVKA